ncbi:MAG: formimidoylglutamase [Bacteroidia bacterium]|nr:formimidoylglutamase [Bacteroidia bacterium]
MEVVKVYAEQDVRNYVRHRSGEEKIGELVQCFKSDWKEDVKQLSACFVLLGIAEDIGVRANYGRPGANTALKPSFDSFLNQQNNTFVDPSEIAVLGEIVVDDLMEKASSLDTKNKNDVAKLRDLVAILDERVSETIRVIISAGKIPIVIGGGHNNSFGNIKGASDALSRKINVINCDPHLDFRPKEGRHSGNGFSYAYEQGYLGKYAVFAMHEQYNNKNSIEVFRSASDRLFYNTYESVFVKEDLEFKAALKQCIGFVKGDSCGIEIDLDAITNVPSSAKTSSGISPVEARQFIHQAASNLNSVYLHIAEGAPVLSHIKADNKTGKLIAYLVTDFIKACSIHKQ